MYKCCVAFACSLRPHNARTQPRNQDTPYLMRDRGALRRMAPCTGQDDCQCPAQEHSCAWESVSACLPLSRLERPKLCGQCNAQPVHHLCSGCANPDLEGRTLCPSCSRALGIGRDQLEPRADPAAAAYLDSLLPGMQAQQVCMHLDKCNRATRTGVLQPLGRVMGWRCHT